MKKALLALLIGSLSVAGASAPAWAYRTLLARTQMQAYPAPSDGVRCTFRSAVEKARKQNNLTRNQSPLRPPQNLRRPSASR